MIKTAMIMNNGEIIIYETQDGQTAVDVRLDNETVWLNQDQLATLFDKSKSTINEHINNVFKDGELRKEEVVRKFRITTQHGAMQGKNNTRKMRVDGMKQPVHFLHRFKRCWVVQYLHIPRRYNEKNREVSN